MKWSVRMGRIAGIDIRIHLTFVFLLAYVGISYYSPRGEWADVASGLIFVCTLFAIVVMHELGHALAARHYGIRTRDITLLPIGGVARLERMPDDPKQELVVALAGPAVNVVLAVLLAVVLLPTTVMSVLGGIRPVGGFFLANLLLVNVSLAAFNLIPAFPMDGGRVLRALLALRRDYVSATQTAATVGQALALAFGFLGLLYNPLLIFIALFVWMGASEEASAAQLRSALAGIPLSRAMITDFRTLSPHDPLARAVTHVIAGFQQDFPVVDASGAVVGVLTQPALLKSLAQHGESGLVEESMDRHFVAAAPEEMVDRVFVRLAECACRSLPVVAAGRLVGMVTPDNVGEFIMIQTALGNARQHQLAAQAVGAH